MLTINKPPCGSYSSKVENLECQQFVKNFSKVKNEMHMINEEHKHSLKATHDKQINDYLKANTNLFQNK